MGLIHWVRTPWLVIGVLNCKELNRQSEFSSQQNHFDNFSVNNLTKYDFTAFLWKPWNRIHEITHGFLFPLLFFYGI